MPSNQFKGYDIAASYNPQLHIQMSVKIFVLVKIYQQGQGLKLTFWSTRKVLLVRFFSTSKLVRPLANYFLLKCQ